MVRPSGRTTSVSSGHPEKAEELMTVTEEGMETSEILEQLLKASLQTVVTPSSMITFLMTEE